MKHKFAASGVCWYQLEAMLRVLILNGFKRAVLHINNTESGPILEAILGKGLTQTLQAL